MPTGSAGRGRANRKRKGASIDEKQARDG